MKLRGYPVLIVAALASSACFQVGPKDEPLHIILDVNIKVQVERDVAELWDTVEETATVEDTSSSAGGAQNP